MRNARHGSRKWQPQGVSSLWWRRDVKLFKRCHKSGARNMCVLLWNLESLCQWNEMLTNEWKMCRDSETCVRIKRNKMTTKGDIIIPGLRIWCTLTSTFIPRIGSLSYQRLLCKIALLASSGAKKGFNWAERIHRKWLKFGIKIRVWKFIKKQCWHVTSSCLINRKARFSIITIIIFWNGNSSCYGWCISYCKKPWDNRQLLAEHYQDKKPDMSSMSNTSCKTFCWTTQTLRRRSSDEGWSWADIL